MRVILFVAELGSGFGHVRRLLPLARAAAAAGHRTIFLVANPDEVAPCLASERLEVRRAPPPAARGEPRRGAVASSHADILGGVGFGDAELLRDTASRWDSTLAALRPAALVCESSPFLLLACFGSALPLLSSGHGFLLPPPHLPQFPPLWDGPSLYSEPELLDAVVSTCRARGRAGPAALPALLAGTAHAVTGFDVLDPYRAHRRQAAFGPPELDIPPASTAAQEDVFAYLLGDGSASLKVLEALAQAGVSGRVFVRRGTDAQRRALAGSRITWLDGPEPTRDALERARLVVHHGSMLMSEEALAAGRPQLVVPLFLEHLLTARALGGLGVAAVIRPTDGGDDIGRAVAGALSDTAMARAARSFAESYRQTAAERERPATLLSRVVLPAGATA